MIKPFYRGDTKLIKLRFRDTDNLPVDITGWILYVTFKLDQALSDTASGVVQVKIDLSDADTLGLKYRDLSAANGTVTLRVGPELTRLLSGDETYYYDIQRVSPILDGGDLLQGHDVWTLAGGTVKVNSDITKTYSEGTLGQAIP